MKGRLNKNYGTSDQTRQVLTGKTESAARAYGCIEQYISGIKNGYEPDPYPRFREWSQILVLGEASISPYINDLEEIEAMVHGKASANTSVADLLIGKLNADCENTAVIVKASEDGTWDERDCDNLLKVCDRMKEQEAKLRETVLAKKLEHVKSRNRLKAVA